MQNAELKQVKATIDLMSGTIGVLTRSVERLSGGILDQEVADRLKEIDKAKAEAISTLEYLDSTGRV